MGDYWNPGEPVSASKLNRNSASTGSISYDGPGAFDRSGNNWSMVGHTAPDVQGLWVAVDSVKEYVFRLGSSNFRTIYKHSWTEVEFDPVYGLWRKTSRKGSCDCDPLMHYDPTQQIPLSPVENAAPFSSTPTYKTVYPVTRDPGTGQLFFFS